MTEVFTMLVIIIGLFCLLTQTSAKSVESGWGNKFESESVLGVYSQVFENE